MSKPEIPWLFFTGIGILVVVLAIEWCGNDREPPAG